MLLFLFPNARLVVARWLTCFRGVCPLARDFFCESRKLSAVIGGRLVVAVDDLSIIFDRCDVTWILAFSLTNFFFNVWEWMQLHKTTNEFCRMCGQTAARRDCDSRRMRWRRPAKPPVLVKEPCVEIGETRGSEEVVPVVLSSRFYDTNTYEREYPAEPFNFVPRASGKMETEDTFNILYYELYIIIVCIQLLASPAGASDLPGLDFFWESSWTAQTTFWMGRQPWTASQKYLKPEDPYRCHLSQQQLTTIVQRHKRIASIYIQQSILKPWAVTTATIHKETSFWPQRTWWVAWKHAIYSRWQMTTASPREAFESNAGLKWWSRIFCCATISLFLYLVILILLATSIGPTAGLLDASHISVQLICEWSLVVSVGDWMKDQGFIHFHTKVLGNKQELLVVCWGSYRIAVWIWISILKFGVLDLQTPNHFYWLRMLFVIMDARSILPCPCLILSFVAMFISIHSFRPSSNSFPSNTVYRHWRASWWLCKYRAKSRHVSEL